MAPSLVRLYEQMPEPKYVIAMGACTITGGMFSTDSYSTVRGVDKLIPVDVYLPGCPPKPEAVIDAITKLRKKISREIFEDRTVSQQENRCFTTNHKFCVRRSTHTGNYDQELLYQSPSTSEIPSETFFKSKSSVSPHELVNQTSVIPILAFVISGVLAPVSEGPEKLSSYESGSRFDFDRYGLVPRSSPRQADLILTAGTVTMKMAPSLVRLYEQMPEPKYVIAMGACTITGGMFSTDSYSTVRGVDKLIPVDVYLPGCPPKPEAVIDAITKLRKKISREIFEDRTVSQQENRCFTTNHKFCVRRSTHTGNYDQELLYQSPSTSEIPSETFFKSKSSVSPHELVNQTR
ncbi:hypothetical protein C4D60_Mb00t15010 [Musa balbisiana]|uniref:NADH:ubiquinone oxidoreductase-like 20kDa subunit domain-containing protein n=1 Tax=Musa balbisiana TaxID=52838 RepID=A0A4S8I5G9_MUSBA|nr:hypothetical protein C4D60_Mb00t15010 [Musa balbisiana]